MRGSVKALLGAERLEQSDEECDGAIGVGVHQNLGGVAGSLAVPSRPVVEPRAICSPLASPRPLLPCSIERSQPGVEAAVSDVVPVRRRTAGARGSGLAKEGWRGSWRGRIKDRSRRGWRRTS